MADTLEEPLFSCSREGCREECSYPVDMLRLHNGKPICDDCYGYLSFKEQAPDPDNEEETLMWGDLPPFVPAIIATAREVEGLREKLTSLEDTATKAVSDLGTKLGRKEAELDAALADLAGATREVEGLRAEVARLRGHLSNINRKASPDPERTMSEASNDLYWCACEARAALEGKGGSHDQP